MPTCSFCSKKIKSGTGKLFVQNSGRTFWFCSNKCEKNLLKLKRKPIKFKWTQEKKTKEKKEGSS
ncbi:MAG: 50S ribosomal protein L24e [Nanoarchaeota archaeon]|jgi:large subunit ribosomal protein L24e|nr:50S ribosomal protein L24e [Nanoarchaeota archaeon]